MASEQRSTDAAPATPPAEATQPVPASPPVSAQTPRVGVPIAEGDVLSTPEAEARREAEEPKERESSAPEPDKSDEGASKTHKERRNRFEALLPGMIRRGIERSIEAGLSTFERSLETGRETKGAVREKLNEVKMPRDVASAVGKALSEAKLPRELASAVFNQLDDTKNDVLRIIAGEFRDFLEATDIASELKAALTSLSFEIRTEIRFIPNDAGEGVKADVRAKTRIKRADAKDRNRSKKSKGRSEEEEDEDDE
jgi:hypothetical protein